MKILGISHPIPTRYATRIYENGKNVFIGKSYLGKASQGDKFIIYESHGTKAYTAWADIKSIGRQKTNSIISKYEDKLIVTPEEFRTYSKGKSKMNVIEFENLEIFKNPVKPERFVTVTGKYIYKDEFDMIAKNKG